MNYYLLHTLSVQLNTVAMSARLQKALSRIKVKTLGDLLNYSESELKAKRLTNGEIKEIKEFLKEDFNIH